LTTTPTVHGADYACDTYLAVLGNLDFGNLRDIAAKHELNRHAAAVRSGSG